MDFPELKMNEMARTIAVWRAKKGFKTPDSILGEKNHNLMIVKLMLVVTEVSEAVEAIRHGDEKNFWEEIADIHIRLMDIVGTCNHNIEKGIVDKMNINVDRPFLHGKVC